MRKLFLSTCRKLAVTFLASLSISYTALSQVPSITKITPLSAPAGSTVLISGTGFSNVPEENIVYFGGVKVPVSYSGTLGELKITVPAGTAYEPVRLTVKGRTATSSDIFVTKFSGAPAVIPQDAFVSIQELGGFSKNGSGFNLSRADLDGDGLPDLAVIESGQRLCIFRNRKSSSSPFSEKPDVVLSFTDAPFSIFSISDYDMDGRPDLLIPAKQSESAFLMRNTLLSENMGFIARDVMEAHKSASAIVFADLDKDGKPELILANLTLNKLSVYKNNSIPASVQFEKLSDIDLNGGPISIIAADMDGDGLDDLIWVSNDGRISVLRNTSTKGMISLTSIATLSVGESPLGIAAGDLNGDRKPDMVVSSESGIAVFPNTGEPGTVTFGQQIQVASLQSYGPGDVALSDVNGDGRPDIILANRKAHDIRIWQNKSEERELTFVNHVSFKAGQGPSKLAIADFTGDGTPDIAVSNAFSGTVSILKNQSLPLPPVISSFNPSQAVIGSNITITGNNFKDVSSVSFGNTPAVSFTVISQDTIVAVTGNGSSGSVMIKNSYGTDEKEGFIFIPKPLISVSGPTITTPGQKVILNAGNGPEYSYSWKKDGVFLEGANGSVYEASITGWYSLVITSGTKTFESDSVQVIIRSVPRIDVFSPVSSVPGTVLTIRGAGFSNTKGMNIVYLGAVRASVVSEDSTTIKVTVPYGATHSPVTVTCNSLTAASSRLFVPASKNEPPPVPASTTQYTEGTVLKHVITADLDNDGKPEMIAININERNGNTFSIYRNTSSPGSPSFVRTDLSTMKGLSTIAAGDIDGDGLPDLVIGNMYNAPDGSRAVWIYKNLSTAGEIAFGEPVKVEYIPTVYEIQIRDIDNDGRPDLILKNHEVLSVLMNTSLENTTSFKMGYEYQGHFAGAGLLVNDLDLDGRADIVISTSETPSPKQSVVLLQNSGSTGAISFTISSFSLPGNARITNLYAGDVDNDEKIDLILRTSVNTVACINNSNAGGLSFAAPADLYITGTGFAFAFYDFNGDSKTDVASGGYGSIAVKNNYSTPGNIDFRGVLSFKSDPILNLLAGDLDGNGLPDVVMQFMNERKEFSVLWNPSFIQAPQIKAVYPLVAVRGDTIRISGDNFFNISAVKFGEVPVKWFRVVSPELIETVVWESPGSHVSVITNTEVNGNTYGFRLVEKPVISVLGESTFLKGTSVQLKANMDPNTSYTYIWKKDGAVVSTGSKNYYQASESGSYTVSMVVVDDLYSFSSYTFSSDIVNLKAVFRLPANNFSLKATAASCRGSSTGSISLIAKQGLSYIVVLTGDSLKRTVSFSDNVDFDQLPAGIYHIAVKLPSEPDFEQLYTIEIAEPKELSVYSGISPGTKTLELNMSGGERYTIELNGNTYRTSSPTISLPLIAGENKLGISTDLNCQGKVERTISYSEHVSLYPNPFSGHLSIRLPDSSVKDLRVEIRDINNRLVLAEKYVPEGNVVNLQILQGLAPGVYVVILTADSKQWISKAFKQ